MRQNVTTRNGGETSALDGGTTRKGEDCRFADVPSPSLLKRLLKGEGFQQNVSPTANYHHD